MPGGVRTPRLSLRFMNMHEYVRSINGFLILNSAMKLCQHVACAKSANRSVHGRRVQPMMRIVRTRLPPEMAVTRW